MLTLVVIYGLRQAFIERRLPWRINLLVDTGISMSKDEEREVLLNELLEGVDSNHLSIVTVSFTTPPKETTIEVDLKDVERYLNFVYL